MKNFKLIITVLILLSAFTYAKAQDRIITKQNLQLGGFGLGLFK